MFLKSVKARGFKSFARSVEFAFEPGITVVVGPNGSGKSNISDSVTWAMGEQSPTAVRGNSMQDVIFSGSDKLAPAGMAEVEILLDNSSGAMPIEFSEVLISRRLYRDGDGAYFINKSPCRLIDVTELLSDAGLGRNTHSIISQGKVDAILESKPSERRAYIEEAAGLGKYKKRRHRAERKLEAVRRNLERLFDVEEEVRANLRPLKRQATAAERSSKLDRQIAAAGVRLTKGKLEVIKAELASAEAASQDAVARRAGLEEQLAATAGERRRTEELLASSLKEHKQLADRFYSLKSRQEGLAGRRDAAAARLEMLAGAIQRSQTRIDNLQGQQERVEDELERAREEHRRDQEQLAAVEKELEARRQELEGVEEEAGRRRQTAKEKNRRVGELDALKGRYTHQIEYLSQRQEKLAGLLERAGLEAANRRRELERLLELSRSEEERMDQWRAAAERAEAELKQIKDELGAVDARRQEAASELRRVGEDLQIAKARITFLGDSDRARSGLPPAAKKIAEEHGLKSLVELMEVEPGYERAVSAVMGNTLFALAARDLGHAREMLAAARAAELGGVEFVLPGDATAASRVSGNAAQRLAGDATDHPAGDDYLLDHVRISPEWQAHAAPLLAGVRLADDLDAIGAAGGTWVTRDGVVYRPGRRLLSFKADPPSSVVLRQRNERRLLEAERVKTEELHEELENRLAALHLEFEELDGRRLAAEKALHDVLQERRDAEGSAAATQRQQRVLEQEIELKEASRGHLGAEQAKLEEELAGARRRLEETDCSLAEMNRSEEPDGAASDEALAQSRTALSQEVTELKITAARVRERERVAGQAIGRSVPALERLKRELETTAYQLAAFQRLQPVCSRLLAGMESVLGIYGRVSAGLAVELKAGEELAERHSTALKEFSQAEAELQQELSRASNATTDCEVSLTRLRDQVYEQESHLQKLYAKYPDEDLAAEEAAAAVELDEAEAHMERLMRRRELIGPVNPLAQQEYEEMLERQQFLAEQRQDLERSLEELTGLIGELTGRIENSFAATFAAVRDHFADVIATLFPGGEGRLTLTREEPPEVDEDGEILDEGEDSEPVAAAESPRVERRGIEISVKPPRKAVRSLSLLSGGERSLVAIAFLFAIFLARPAPFYILDEVEAALDDVNIDRLLAMLKRYQTRTQFIIITHQKRTMEVADTLYGVTMGPDGTSKVLSRKMKKDAQQEMADEDDLELESGAGTGPAIEPYNDAEPDNDAGVGEETEAALAG